MERGHGVIERTMALARGVHRFSNGDPHAGPGLRVRVGILVVLVGVGVRVGTVAVVLETMAVIVPAPRAAPRPA